MTPAREFLEQAQEFCALVDGVDGLSSRTFVERLCETLPRLYAAAVALPAEVADEELDERLYRDDLTAVYGTLSDRFAAANIYWLVYDQFDQKQQEVVAGALTDDIGDIYCDLREVLADPRGEVAAGDWRMDFDIHWSNHAVNALAPLNQVRVGWGYAPPL